MTLSRQLGTTSLQRGGGEGEERESSALKRKMFLMKREEGKASDKFGLGKELRRKERSLPVPFDYL